MAEVTVQVPDQPTVKPGVKASEMYGFLIPILTAAGGMAKDIPPESLIPLVGFMTIGAIFYGYYRMRVKIAAIAAGKSVPADNGGSV